MNYYIYIYSTTMAGKQQDFFQLATDKNKYSTFASSNKKNR